MRKIMLTSAVAMAALLVSFAAADPAGKPKPDAKLTEGSMWTGTIGADARKANGKTVKATLKVTARTGEEFDATFRELGKNRRSLDVHGEVSRGGKLKLKPTKVNGGAWGNHVLDKVWIGEVKDDRLTFRVVDDEESPDAQGHEAELTLQP